ncbi:MAG: NAD(P)-binding protein, partial [bacterium]
MKIAIIGAGVAGLTLAILLTDQGHTVSLHERRSRDALMTEGLFLTLAPNGTRLLSKLDPGFDLAQAGIPTTGIALLDERGHQLGFFDQSDHQEIFGGPSLTLARNALIAMLLGWAERRGITVSFDRSSASSCSSVAANRRGSG